MYLEGGGDSSTGRWGFRKNGEVAKRDSVTRVTPRILYFFYFVANVQFEGVKGMLVSEKYRFEGIKMRKVGGFCLKVGCFLCYLISN